jgi:hypothetical protein
MSRGPASAPGECAALDHLARTRHHLREALPASHPAATRTPAPSASGAGSAPTGAHTGTAASELRQALATAWQQHPLHQGAELAAGLARLALQGAAERHPLGLVVGAGLLGMVVARSQPWRYLIRPALRSGWPARLALDVLAQVPMRSWVAALAANAPAPPPPPGPGFGHPRPD